MSDEFEGFEGDDPRPVEETPFETLGLVTASSLAPELSEEEPAELGFEPDDHYLSFPIVSEADWPDLPRHQLWKQRFYVRSPKGTLGLVPWPGSRIVWPWEAAWGVDLHRTEVESLLKEEKKEKK